MSVVACAQCAAPVPVDTLAAEGSYICVRVACGNFGLLHPKCFGHFIAAKQGVIPPTDTDTSEDSNAATSAPAPAVAGKSEAKGGAETDSGSSAAAGGKPKGVLLPLDAFNAMYATAPNAAGRRGRKPKPRGRPAPKKTARSGASSNTNSAVSSPRGSSRLAAKAGNSSPAVASPRARSRNPSIAKIEAYYEREKKVRVCRTRHKPVCVSRPLWNGSAVEIGHECVPHFVFHFVSGFWQAYLANKETVLQEWSLGPDDLWCRYCGVRSTTLNFLCTMWLLSVKFCFADGNTFSLFLSFSATNGCFRQLTALGFQQGESQRTTCSECNQITLSH